MLVRLIVVFIAALLLFGLTKMGTSWLPKWGRSTPTKAALEEPEISSLYPTAKLIRPDYVLSPYREDVVLDVRAFRSGQLVNCDVVHKPFFVPWDRNPNLVFGEIQGIWDFAIEESYRQTYEVRFFFDLGIVRATGMRVETQQVQAQPSSSSLSFEGIFQGNRLKGLLKSIVAEQGTYECDLAFDSATGYLHGHGMRDGRSIAIMASKKHPNSPRIPALARDEKGFIPDGWKLIDRVRGVLPGALGNFLALVIEENNQLHSRWLVVAHAKGREKFAAENISPLAIRAGTELRGEDWFRGIALPSSDLNSARPGEFLIRHERMLNGQRDSMDFHFRYEPQAKKWVLVHGLSYHLNPQQIPSGSKDEDHLVASRRDFQAGLPLNEFNIHLLPELAGP